MGIFGDIFKIAAPVAGFALGGPAGAMLGSAASAGISGAQNKSKANALNKQAQGIAMGNWRDTAPLRSRALEMALAPRAQREDTSALFADPGNPYSRVIPRPAPSADLGRVTPPTTATPEPVPGRQMATPIGMQGVMNGRLGRALQAKIAAKQGVRGGGSVGGVLGQALRGPGVEAEL